MNTDVPQNSVADLIRVAGRLNAGGAVLARAAAALGLATAVPELATPPARPPLPPPHDPPPAPAAAHPVRANDGVVVRPAGEDPRSPRPPRLAPAEPPVRTPPRRLRGTVTELLPPPPDTTAVPLEPLFRPAHERAILSTLVSARRPGTDLDVEAVVARVARRLPVDRVARRSAPTTRLGVQLLVDHGPALGPFRRDLRLLATALRRVVGQDAVEVLAFRDDLTQVTPLSGERRRFTPGPGARPVLAATDLGIAATGGAPRPADWLELAERARAGNIPFVVLVPYPPARWPSWAARLTLVHWDRPTSVGHVQRAARQAAALAGFRP